MNRIFAILLLLFFAVPADAADKVLTLTGIVRDHDGQHYLEMPFEVPAGTVRLNVAFSHDGKEQHTVIDLGVRDPDRFRGWSGGARNVFTISATDATPGYLPGPLPKGRWHLVLGIPNIRKGVITHFTATVTASSNADAGLYAKPLREGPGWFRGDLHSHTAHSDAKCRSRSGAALVPCPVFLTLEAANKRGLDFLVVSDHNATSQYDAMAELQPYFDQLLLIPGRELTTFRGHANMLGGMEFVDFRLDGRRNADQMIADAHRQGALFTINHPGLPSDERCMGCGWTAPVKNQAAIDAVEVVNGGTMNVTGHGDGPGSGFAFWQSLLDQGLHPTAVAGSDNHNATEPSESAGAIGTPLTVVHAATLSQKDILAGIKAGHVFIDVAGTRERSIVLDAEIAGRRAIMGERLSGVAQQPVSVHLSIIGVEGGRAEIVHDRGLAVAPTALDVLTHNDNRSFEIVPPVGQHWLYVKVFDAKGVLALVGNPIYFEN